MDFVYYEAKDEKANTSMLTTTNSHNMNSKCEHKKKKKTSHPNIK